MQNAILLALLRYLQAVDMQEIFIFEFRSEKEFNRRQEMLLNIRFKSKQMAASLSSSQSANRCASSSLFHQISMVLF